MSDTLLTGAVITLGVGIISKIIWDWLKQRNTFAESQIIEIIKRMDANITTLNNFHNRTNGSGRPLAYFNDEAIEKVEELRKDLKTLPVVLGNILSELKALHNTLDRAARKLKD